MKRFYAGVLGVIGLLILLLPLSGEASLCDGLDVPVVPVGFVSQSVTSSTAVALSTIPATVVYAILHIESHPIRWRDDGTDPTTTVGVQENANDSLVVCRGSLGGFRMIATGTTATVRVVYYGK